MNDVNPYFLALLGLATSVGALIAGVSGALWAVAIITGLTLALSVYSSVRGPK